MVRRTYVYNLFVYYFHVCLPHDVEDLPGEDSVLLVLLLLRGLAGDVEVAVQLGDLVLLEGVGQLLHLNGQVWNGKCFFIKN